ncbi:MAG: ester cyclase [Acidimicrobiales bacterium]
MNGVEREAQVRRFVDEVWNGRNYEAAADLYSEDYVNPFGKGPAAKAAGIRVNHQAFPDDMRVEIDDLIVAGDTAILRFTLRGTDLGGYAGRPPTGRAVEEWGVNIMRFKNDRVASEFMGADKLGLFIQLGVIEDPWPRATPST